MSSFWLDESTSIRYYEGQAFSYGEGDSLINYTRAGATPETFAGLGFVQVVLGERPDDRFYNVSGPDDEGQYTSTPKPLDDQTDPDTGVVTQGIRPIFLNAQLEAANKILNPTDWYVTRFAETGVAIPADWDSWRQSIRATASTRWNQVNDVTTTAELAALITNPPEIPDPNDPDHWIPNPAPHLTPWPADPDGY